MSVQHKEGPWHVVGYRWDTKGVALSLRALDGSCEETSIHTLVDRVVFETTGERLCTGWYDAKRQEVHTCPGNNPPKRGAQCIDCSKREGLMVCIMCNGFRCPQHLPERAKRYCHQTHHLYLACFGGGPVKVGTASNARRLVRVLEQGPLAAAWIASDFGPRIKRMEHTISKMGYTEFVRRKDKERWITSTMTEEEARSKVDAAYTHVADTLEGELYDALGSPEAVPRPAIASVDLRGRDLGKIDLKTGMHICGDLVAARGHVVVLRDDRGLFSLDLVALKGYPITLKPTRPAHTRVVQTSLFG